MWNEMFGEKLPLKLSKSKIFVEYLRYMGFSVYSPNLIVTFLFKANSSSTSMAFIIAQGIGQEK
jgi:hypothetical protein